MEDVRHVDVDGGWETTRGPSARMHLEASSQDGRKWLVTCMYKPLVEAIWNGNNPT